MLSGARVVAVAVVLLAASGIAACHVERSAPPATTMTLAGAKPFDLAKLKTKRVRRGQEWRDVSVLPRGTSAFVCESIPKGGVFRLIFASQSVSTTPPSATVFVGGNQIARIEAPDIDQFVKYQVDLSEYRSAGGLRVVFESEFDLLLAVCDVGPVPSKNSKTDSASVRPNVLLFLVDALRADHLGCYGYPRNTSPHVDAFANQATRFTSAFAQASWTRPSVASLLTSTYPEIHGAKDRSDIMRQDLATIESALGAAGYETKGFMSNATCLPMWGIGVDFSRFVDVNSYDITPDKDADVVNTVIDELQRRGAAPWFYYVHTIGPHEPYEPPAPFDTAFRSDAAGKSEIERTMLHNMDLYDGEIAFTDVQFGRLVDELQRTGIYDDTLIVFIADHGEEFGEHGGRGHGSTLYDEQIRVPCVVKLPEAHRAEQRIDGVIELIDIAPTVLEVCGVTRPGSFQGRSLKPELDGVAPKDATAYASLFLEKASVEAARNAQSKYIHDIVIGKKVWFDLATDPHEQHQLAGPPTTGAMLERYAARINVAGQSGLHILVTGSLKEHHTISGRVKGTSVGKPLLQYDANNGEVAPIAGGFDFTVRTKSGPDSPSDIVAWHENVAEQNHAHITAPADLASPMTITITMDGAPAPAASVFVGNAMENRALIKAVIDPKTILARPERFAPMALPRRLAVYVWFVPPVDTITDANLDPGMAEALRAMGYVH